MSRRSKKLTGGMPPNPKDGVWHIEQFDGHRQKWCSINCHESTRYRTFEPAYRTFADMCKRWRSMTLRLRNTKDGTMIMGDILR